MTAAQWREHLAATKGRLGRADLEALLDDLAAAEARAFAAESKAGPPLPPPGVINHWERESPPEPPKRPDNTVDRLQRAMREHPRGPEIERQIRAAQLEISRLVDELMAWERPEH